MAIGDASARRSVVPQAAGRSLWLSAAWTGAGAALVGAVIAVAAVAVCWLPASGGSGGSGNAGSALRAGVLTFLAALHGGITVDGLPAQFVPLGMTIIAAVIAWRAGAGLADAAAELEEAAPGRLARAVAVQAAVFAATCGVLARLATLGSSRVSVLAAVLAGFVLFAGTGGLAFVRSSPLRELVAGRLPGWLPTATRGAAAGLAVYLGAGALLVAGSLVLHHARVETLSQQLGGGWSGVPILLLGVLAAPNAAIAGASYLAGPGFAVGSGVSLGSAAHGTLPAFPILGALPTGPATTPAWLLVAATPAVAGVAVARVVGREGPLLMRLRAAGIAGALAAAAGLVLAWQGGGSIGSGALSAIGASPWQFGLTVGGALGVAAAGVLTALAALTWWRARPLALAAGGDTFATVAAFTAGGPADEDAVDEDDTGDADHDEQDDDDHADQDDQPTVVLTAVSDPDDEGEAPEPGEGAALAG